MQGLPTSVNLIANFAARPTTVVSVAFRCSHPSDRGGAQGGTNNRRFPTRQPRPEGRLDAWVHLPDRRATPRAALAAEATRGPLRSKRGRVDAEQPRPPSRLAPIVKLHLGRGVALDGVIRSVSFSTSVKSSSTVPLRSTPARLGLVARPPPMFVDGVVAVTVPPSAVELRIGPQALRSVSLHESQKSRGSIVASWDIPDAPGGLGPSLARCGRGVAIESWLDHGQYGHEQRGSPVRGSSAKALLSAPVGAARHAAFCLISRRDFRLADVVARSRSLALLGGHDRDQVEPPARVPRPWAACPRAWRPSPRDSSGFPR